MSERLTLTIVYERDPESEWITVSVPEVPGVLSQGRTREEAREMILDALAGMLELYASERPPSGEVIGRESLRIVVEEGSAKEMAGPRADLSGHYVLVGEPGDGRLVLAPDRAGPISLTDTRISAMRERTGTQPISPEEFDRHFGDLPTDGEG